MHQDGQKRVDGQRNVITGMANVSVFKNTIGALERVTILLMMEPGVKMIKGVHLAQ